LRRFVFSVHYSNFCAIIKHARILVTLRLAVKRKARA
jgi:hypothetical protein